MSTAKSDTIIETRGLTRRFKSHDAVRDLDLRIDKGRICAFLGPNGAGKTTTIKMLMGILRPSGGEARVFGTDSGKLGQTEFEKIGYVSENQEMPEWMTVKQLMDYCAQLYPSWDEAFCTSLLDQFSLPRDQQLKNLSRGMRMKAALISSLAYRPELLVLDEPFSGLDPLVREEFISGMLELTEQESWTILVSSHDIDEVERLADSVAIINQGQLALNETTESLQARFRKVDVTTSAENPDLPHPMPGGWCHARSAGRSLQFTDSSFAGSASEDEIRQLVGGVTSIETHGMSLREIYLAIARDFRGARQDKTSDAHAA
ncbi:MAG: ABC transporter ATP-binding protein [Verrucomicrobiales bacterium]